MQSDEHSTLATIDDPAATPTPSYATADLIADMRAMFAVQTRTLLRAMFAAVLFNVVFNIVLVVLVD